MRGVDTLLAAVETVLPDEGERRLLRACLMSGGDVRTAWQEWLGSYASYGRALLDGSDALKALQPLLYDSLRQNAVDVAGATLTHLKAALVREERRTEAHRKVVGETLGRLSDAGVPAMVLGGTLLAETHYRSPALRHCAGLHLLIGLETAGQAVRLLDAPPFEVQAAGNGVAGVRLRHSSGMPLVLDTRFLPGPSAAELTGEVWKRSGETQVCGIPVRSPAPEDMLLHLCVHPFLTGGCGGLFWVCDSHLLVCSQAGLDWDLLTQTAKHAAATLPLGAMLGFMAGTLGTPIPPGSVDALQGAAPSLAPVARDLALLGARLNGGPGCWRLLLRLPGVISRLRLTFWTLFPSPAYTRWVCRQDNPWALPLLYLYRPLRAMFSTGSLR